MPRFRRWRLLCEAFSWLLCGMGVVRRTHNITGSYDELIDYRVLLAGHAWERLRRNELFPNKTNKM